MSAGVKSPAVETLLISDLQKSVLNSCGTLRDHCQLCNSTICSSFMILRGRTGMKNFSTVLFHIIIIRAIILLCDKCHENVAEMSWRDIGAIVTKLWKILFM
jgi:hypothetical protein